VTTATQQVLAVLQAGSLPPEAQAFVLTIFAGEVGDKATDPWTCEFGYTYYTGSLATFPNASSSPPWTGKLIPGKPGWISTALGIGQILYPTWEIWSKLPGAPSPATFEPPSQCALVWLGGADQYHKVTGRSLLADLQAGTSMWGNVQTALLPTWPGGAAKFSAHYPSYLAMVKAAPAPPPAPAEPIIFAYLVTQAGSIINEGTISIPLPITGSGA